MKNNKIHIIFLFVLINLIVFSNEETNNENNSQENVFEIIEGEEVKPEEELIYLDRIVEEKKEEVKKTGKISEIINKIDNKVNPVLKFYVPSSYGSWYLIKTSSKSEAQYENIRYDFKQEENGYRIVKSYYDPKNKSWSETDERGWIKEKKGKVYLKIENKYFKNFSNEIIYFDSNYGYMIIKYEKDNTIKVFSRYPLNKLLLVGDEREKYEETLESSGTLYDITYDYDNRNMNDEISAEKNRQKERAEKIEKELMENSEEFFKIK